MILASAIIQHYFVPWLGSNLIFGFIVYVCASSVSGLTNSHPETILYRRTISLDWLPVSPMLWMVRCDRASSELASFLRCRLAVYRPPRIWHLDANRQLDNCIRIHCSACINFYSNKRARHGNTTQEVDDPDFCTDVGVATQRVLMMGPMVLIPLTEIGAIPVLRHVSPSCNGSRSMVPINSYF